MSFFSDFLTWLRGTPPEPEPEAHEVFALRIKALLESTGTEVRYDAEKYALHIAGHVCGLGNHFDEWQLLPADEREAGLQRYAGLIFGLVTHQPENSPDWEVARANLRPRIRPRLVIERLLLEHAIEHPEAERPKMLSQPLSRLLGVQLAYDHPNTISSVQVEDLENWEVSEEEALAVARANIALSTPEGSAQQVDEGLWVWSLGDCYDNARMFLTEELRALPLKGRPVVLPACRDAVLVTGEDDLVGLGHMLEHTVALMQQPRFDTAAPLLLDGEEWREWAPDAADPRRGDWRELIHRAHAGTYGELKELLERLFQVQGVDRFVASASMLSNGQDAWTYAVWPPVEGQLPEVELVAVFEGESPDSDSFLVPWADLLEVAGELLTRDDTVFLPYWRFDESPTGEVLERLRERAFEPPKPA